MRRSGGILERKTKIIATLGPAVQSVEAIAGLVAAGMDVARLNFSHGDRDTHRMFHQWVRSAAEKSGAPVAILQDIQGPRIRVGTFPGGAVSLDDGDVVALTPGEGEGDARNVCIENLDAADLSAGSTILMADGLIELEATEMSAVGSVVARVIVGGELNDHKGVAFPGTRLDLPVVTEKDEADLEFGQELGVDYVASSFVSSGDDVRLVKKLSEGTPVIAKIESVVGYANLDDILEEAYGVMVARGDLGVELSFEAVPAAQQDILARANARARISITATEMLESMTASTRPTRAEVTDVFNAVLDGTDAVMLSAETAVGRFPVRAVEAMASICREAENNEAYGRGPAIQFLEDHARFASATAQACVDAAANLGLEAIVAFTESGSTARLISKYRPLATIYAYTPIPATYRRMAAYAGVTPLMFGRVNSTDEMVNYAEQNLVEAGIVAPGDGVVMAAGIPPNRASATNLMKLHAVGSSTAGIPGDGQSSR
ncbi:MAG: pyruvate kinase [Acidimicrobiia bacterium]